MRRIGCFIAIGLTGAFIVAGLVVWLVASTLGTLFGNTLAIVAALLLGMAVAMFLRGFGRLAGPLDDITDAASRVAAGDLAARVREPSHGPRPIRQLVRSFNTMAARLEVDEEQRRSLLADVSHELRTPLTVIAGNAEAMLDGVWPTDPEHLRAILDETRTLTRLVEDLRTVSLAEAGTLSLHLEPTDLDVLIADAAHGFRAQADAAGIDLAIDVPADLPYLEIDAVRIREVIANLLANALRHTPSGGSVRVRATANQATIGITVSDSGPGIEADLLRHVFDRFAKGSSSTGSGLGLAIARSLVEAHGGTIEVISRPGAGATFRVLLPVGPIGG